MPVRKGRSESSSLVFDAFLRLPDGAEVEVIWPGVTIDGDLMGLAEHLASGLGYLGRSESWVECRVLKTVGGEPNCGPAELGFEGEACMVLLPRSTSSYQVERTRLVEREVARARESAAKPLTGRALQEKVARSFRARSGVDTLPAHLLDALGLETADLQNRKWDQPPAAYEAVYCRSPNVSPGVLPRARARSRRAGSRRALPTVARYVLAGRPLPRIEDAIKIGEIMRSAAMSRFRWGTDGRSGKRVPMAPWQISGRDQTGRPVRDPAHPHAYWLPEDADGDGWIDHVTVFIASGMDEEIQGRLESVSRIWLTPRGERGKPRAAAELDEWRLALEGFAHPEDLEGSSCVFAASRRWRSITPFLAPGHLKKAGYRGELLRLLDRRGIETAGVTVREVPEVSVGGTPRRALHFHRFRTRGRGAQRDSAGALLEVGFPRVVRGPLALGYASHFGLGMFGGR